MSLRRSSVVTIEQVHYRIAKKAGNPAIFRIEILRLPPGGPSHGALLSEQQLVEGDPVWGSLTDEAAAEEITGNSRDEAYERALERIELYVAK